MTPIERRILAALLALFALGLALNAARRRGQRISFEIQRDAPRAAPAAFPGLSSPRALDLNRCTEAELELLPGIGPALARAVVAHRRKLGGFTDARQVAQARGFGRARYEKLRTRLEVDGKCGPPLEVVPAPRARVSRKRGGRQSGAAAGPVDLNRATVQQLEALPGIGPNLAAKIVELRSRRGGFRSPTELLELHEVSLSLYRRIEAFLSARPP